MIKQYGKFHYPLRVSSDQEIIKSITEVGKEMTVKIVSGNHKRNHVLSEP